MNAFTQYVIGLAYTICLVSLTWWIVSSPSQQWELTDDTDEPLLPIPVQAITGGTPRGDAVFTLITLDAASCINALVLYRSLILSWSRSSSDVPLPSFVVMYGADQNETVISSDTACATLLTSPIARFSRISPLPHDAWYRISGQALEHSLIRLDMFRQVQYRRILYIDVDSVLVQSPRPLFSVDNSADLLATVDPSGGCDRRDVMDSRLMVLRPSRYVYHQLVRTLYNQPWCLSATMMRADQELINCLCGYDGRTSSIRDVRCGLLPYWAATYPSEEECPWHDIADVIAVHFAAPRANGTPYAHYWKCLDEARSSCMLE